APQSVNGLPSMNIAAGAAPLVEAPTETDDALLDCLAIVTRLHGRSMSPEALSAGLPLENHKLTPTLFVRAGGFQGYSARVLKRGLRRISNLVLPAVLLLQDGKACVLTRIVSSESVEIIFPETGIGNKTISLGALLPLYSGYCIFVQPKARVDDRAG